MNVEDILVEKGILYSTQGSDYMVKCINPEHEDSNPSMRIDRLSGIFHCFSCGFKGNIFKHFNKYINNTDIKTAKIKQKIMNMYKKEYLSLPEDYKPFDRDFRNIKASTFLKFEAFTTSLIDKFEDRVVFPLRDPRGYIVAFNGRYISSQAKDKYRIYPHKANLYLFPPIPTPIQDSIILVEGIFDAINLIDKGLPNVMSTLGTDTLSERSYNRIFSYIKILGIKTIYIMFDNDSAGEHATERVRKLLSNNGFITDNIIIPEGYKDPGDFTEELVLQLKGHLYENSTS